MDIDARQEKNRRKMWKMRSEKMRAKNKRQTPYRSREQNNKRKPCPIADAFRKHVISYLGRDGVLVPPFSRLMHKGGVQMVRVIIGFCRQQDLMREVV